MIPALIAALVFTLAYVVQLRRQLRRADDYLCWILERARAYGLHAIFSLGAYRADVAAPPGAAHNRAVGDPDLQALEVRPPTPARGSDARD